MTTPLSEYWQERYESGDTPWEKDGPHPALRTWLNTLPPGTFRTAVVPGCGFGAEVRELAVHGIHATGLDMAPAAIEAAATKTGPGNLCYVHGSIFSPPPEIHGTFDLAVEHTCFCAISPADRRDYVRGILNLLRPGGLFFAIFYRNPAHPPPGPPFRVEDAEIEDLFGAHFRLEDSWIPAETFPGREGREEIRLLRKNKSFPK